MSYLDHWLTLLRVYLSTGSSLASKFTLSQPQSLSPNSLDLGLQVHLPTGSITASKSFSRITRSWHPSASLNSLDYGLQVSLQTRSIMKLEWIAMFTQSWPPSVHSNTLDYLLQVHIQIRTIRAYQFARSSASSASPHSPDRDGLGVYLQTHSIKASNFGRSWPPSASPTRSITASKYIPKEQRGVYEKSAVMEMNRVTGSSPSADPAVDRHHLSAKNFSIRAEWLRQSGRAPSEPSGTPQWKTTLGPAAI